MLDFRNAAVLYSLLSTNERVTMTTLKRTLQEQGRTTTWLVKQLGVSLTTGYQWTSGKAVPVDSRKTEISKLLGISVEELFFGGGNGGSD